MALLPKSLRKLQPAQVFLLALLSGPQQTKSQFRCSNFPKDQPYTLCQRMSTRWRRISSMECQPKLHVGQCGTRSDETTGSRLMINEQHGRKEMLRGERSLTTRKAEVVVVTGASAG